MAKTQLDPAVTQVTLKDVRLSFAHVFEPSKSTDDSEPKFRSAFLMDPESAIGKANLKRLITAIKAVCEAEWGDPDRHKSIAERKPDRVCIGKGETQVSQETGKIYDGYEGMMFAKASSPAKRRPQVVDRRRRPVTESDEVIYSGCYVNAVIRVYTVTDKDKGGNGVFASLEAVQFLRNGEPFGAGPIDIESAFDDLGDEFEDDEAGAGGGSDGDFADIDL